MTGWMSNRGRQNVASFLCHDLNLDWRIGADHFESYLIDHDVMSNYGNWNAAAGLTGGRINKFSISKQSRDYDPEGKYVRYWCPELANVPTSRLFEPWLLSSEEQLKYKCVIGSDYPAPIPIDPHSKSAYDNMESTYEPNKTFLHKEAKAPHIKVKGKGKKAVQLTPEMGLNFVNKTKSNGGGGGADKASR